MTKRSPHSPPLLHKLLHPIRYAQRRNVCIRRNQIEVDPKSFAKEFRAALKRLEERK